MLLPCAPRSKAVWPEPTGPHSPIVLCKQRITARILFMSAFRAVKCDCSVLWRCGAVADFAARAGVPVLRFMHEGFQRGELQVSQERPAAFVFASEEDAQRFPYVEEAPRIILAPARIASAKSIRVYAEMAKALVEARAEDKAGQPSSSAMKVGKTLSQRHMSMCMGVTIPSWCAHRFA